MSTQPPILIDLEVAGQQITELDTGATVTVMSEEVFNRLLPELQLQRSRLELKTYTGEPMSVVGEVPVRVCYRQRAPQDLTLVVVMGAGPTLIGRNWLRHLSLDWNHIKTVMARQATQLNSLLDSYQDVFSEELGTIKPFQAKLAVDPNANPHFHRP